MKLELSDDLSRASIAISADLTAIELQTLIGDLGAIRSRMVPAVARSLSVEALGDASAAIQVDPDVQIALRRSGEFSFWLRSAGLGWIYFEVPAHKARALADYIIARSGPAGDFLGKDGGDLRNEH